MTKKEALEQVVVLGKLQQEEIAICDMYDSCNDCPNLLPGGFCTIRLAERSLRDELLANGYDV